MPVFLINYPYSKVTQTLLSFYYQTYTEKMTGFPILLILSFKPGQKSYFWYLKPSLSRTFLGMYFPLRRV
jgi:hypothetical protein